MSELIADASSERKKRIHSWQMHTWIVTYCVCAWDTILHLYKKNQKKKTNKSHCNSMSNILFCFFCNFFALFLRLANDTTSEQQIIEFYVKMKQVTTFFCFGLLSTDLILPFSDRGTGKWRRQRQRVRESGCRERRRRENECVWSSFGWFCFSENKCHFDSFQM